MKVRPAVRLALCAATVIPLVFICHVAWALSQDWPRPVQRWLAHSAGEGNITRMRLCLALGASPNGTVAGAGPVLRGAAASGHLDSVRFLLSRGSDINIQDKWGLTPLMWACSEGHLEVARFLLDAGADPNIVSQGYEPGATALGAAQKHPDIIALLLDHGAKAQQPPQ